MISKKYGSIFQPFLIVTLLKIMEKIEGNWTYTILAKLAELENDFYKEYEADNKATISDADCKRIDRIIDIVEAFCESLSMKRLVDAPMFSITNVRLRYMGKAQDNFGKTYLGLYTDIKQLRESIERFLATKIFLYLPSDHAEYYNQEDLFGIANNFPEANNEITAAGSCYATENYTACVFHLMRAVEYGLRFIAKELAIPFPMKSEQWGNIIGVIEAEIKKIIRQPKTSQRDDDVVFYNHAATHFTFFKDAWRNQVMHTHSSYDQHQALSIMIHVKELM